MNDQERDELLVRVDERTRIWSDWMKAHDTRHMRWGIAVGAGLILMVLGALFI